MTAAIIHRRPWLPALIVFVAVAVAAVVILAFVLAASDVPTSVPAARTRVDPASNPLLPGCNLGLGVCDVLVNR